MSSPMRWRSCSRHMAIERCSRHRRGGRRPLSGDRPGARPAALRLSASEAGERYRRNPPNPFDHESHDPGDRNCGPTYRRQSPGPWTAVNVSASRSTSTPCLYSCAGCSKAAAGGACSANEPCRGGIAVRRPPNSASDHDTRKTRRNRVRKSLARGCTRRRPGLAARSECSSNPSAR